MSTTAERHQFETEHFVQQYRALSRGAVAAVILAVFSLPAILFPALVPIPLVGVIVGIVAWRAIRRHPDEYTGKRLAAWGTIICGLLLVLSVVGHVLAFVATVPEGYELVSFDQLRSEAPGEAEVVPETAMSLNGKKVYVRGYLHPSVSSLGEVHQFVVVSDFETCCFGGQPKLTHMIEVTTPPEVPVRYSLRRRGFAGTLRVDTRLKSVEGLGGVYYQLRADVVQ